MERLTLPRVRRQFDELYRTLDEYNADLESLRLVDGNESAFSPTERDELRPLLGAYGLDLSHRVDVRATPGTLGLRQQVWRRAAFAERVGVRRLVAERAVVRYGLLIQQMDTAGEAAAHAPVPG